MTKAEPNHISVVIPLFQKERHISATLDSVFTSCEKAGCTYEIVVVDDGSTDGSCDAVLDWIAQTPDQDGIINLIRQKNTGAAGARNRGWMEASFERILFLDADDRWLPDHAGDILSLMDEFPDATLYADAWSEISQIGEPKQHVFGIGSGNRGYLPCFFEAMCSGPMIASSSTSATRRKHLEASGGFPEDITHGEDKVGWGRLALLGPMAWSPRIGAIWDKSAENRSDSGISQPSSAFLDFLVGAREKADLPDAMKSNIQVLVAVEQARMLGHISIYDHETPRKYQEKLFDLGGALSLRAPVT